MQGNSKTYGGKKDLEVEHNTNIHYFHQNNYIPARKCNGATKIQALSTLTLMKKFPRGEFDLVLIQNY